MSGKLPVKVDGEFWVSGKLPVKVAGEFLVSGKWLVTLYAGPKEKNPGPAKHHPFESAPSPHSFGNCSGASAALFHSHGAIIKKHLIGAQHPVNRRHVSQNGSFHLHEPRWNK